MEANPALPSGGGINIPCAVEIVRIKRHEAVYNVLVDLECLQGCQHRPVQLVQLG